MSLLCLSGCGESTLHRQLTEVFVTSSPDKVNDNTVTDNAQGMQTAAPLGLGGFSPFFDGDGSSRMSVFMNDGRYSFCGSIVYGQVFDEETGLAGLGKIELSEAGGSLSANVELLAENVSPYYINRIGESIYCILEEQPSGLRRLVKISAGGGEPVLIYPDDCDYLSIHRGRLYFTDAEGQLISSDVSGSDLSIIIPRRVCFPYFIDDDYLIFQDEGDGESLHLWCLSDGTDIKIADGQCFNPVLCGSGLFFMRAVGGNPMDCRMGRIEFKNNAGGYTLPFTEDSSGRHSFPYFLCDGKSIYGCNNSSSPLAEWKSYKTSVSKAIFVQTIYADRDYIIRYYLDTESGRVERINIAIAGSELNCDLPGV